MIEVLSDVPLATVQDFGRAAQRRYGVGSSGAMDRLALAAGNLLLGNAADAAGIEVPLFPFVLRFDADIDIAVTGAACLALLDDIPLPPWWRCHVRRGQVLTLRHPRQGARAYVTLRGGIDVPLVLGARGTQLRGGFGGFKGRALQRGDVLAVATPAATEPLAPLGALPAGMALPLPLPPQGEDADIAVRVLPAGEYDAFTAAAHQAVWQSAWTVTPQSNRAGYRLAGPALALREQREMRSYGVVPGLIQVPPGGAPIIQLSDANASGGYPKLGTVIEADLWRLGQAPIGSRLRFVQVDYPAATTAWQEVEAYLVQLRRHVGWLTGG